jgi:hypothetical protein
MNPEHGNLIFANSGDAFATEKAATTAITRLGLARNEHKVVEVEGGYAIKFTGGGGSSAPGGDGNGKGQEELSTLERVEKIRKDYPGFFLEACRANGMVKDKGGVSGMTLDDNTKMRTAKGLKLREEDAELLLPTLEQLLSIDAEMSKYWWVRFSAKSSPNDPDSIKLYRGIEQLVVQREEEVCLPAAFLEIADHSYTMKFTHKPGEGRKTAGKVLSYPYQKVREGTRKDFLDLRNAGTAATKKRLEEGEREKE